MRETKPKDISEFLDRLTTVEQEFLWEHIAKIRELDKEEQKPTNNVEPRFKDRYTWKPSEGQLECLGYAIEKAEKDWSPLTNNKTYLTLKALKEQLEKL